jgi:hypothetical protein
LTQIEQGFEQRLVEQGLEERVGIHPGSYFEKEVGVGLGRYFKEVWRWSGKVFWVILRMLWYIGRGYV